MSTRSNIAIKRKNGEVDVIYCHWDGYLKHNGKVLLDHYKDIEKINSLISLGDISFLAENVVPTNKLHSFDTPQDNVVIAYGRDRGEKGLETQHYKNLQDYLDNLDKIGIEYVYVFDEEKNNWEYTKTYYGINFKNLTQEEIDKKV